MNRKQFVLSLIGAGTFCTVPSLANSPRSNSEDVKSFLKSVDQLRSLRQDVGIQAYVHESVLLAYKKSAIKHWGKHPEWLSYSVYRNLQQVSYMFGGKPLDNAEELYDLNIKINPETKYNGFRPTCLNHATNCAMGIMDDTNLTREEKSKEISKILEGTMHFGEISWYKEARHEKLKNIRYLVPNTTV